MHSDEIERRLRLPAPDEPSFLPPLLLPQAVGGFELTGRRVRPGSAGGSLRLLSPRLVIALFALLLALAAATVSGALRLDRLLERLPPELSFTGDGVAFDIPDGWVQLTPNDPFNNSAAFTTLVVANRDVEGCAASEVPWVTPAPPIYVTPAPGASGDVLVVEQPVGGPEYSGIEDQVFACIVEAPMSPGELRVAVSFGAPQEIGVGPIETFDPTAWFGPEAALGDLALLQTPTSENGWNEVIDEMPAKLVVKAGPGADGSDEIRTWAVYDTQALHDVWFVRASMRGPDLGELRAQADEIARSMRFMRRPNVLDAATRDHALAAAIDRMDREERRAHGTRIFGCFPRTPGERSVLLEDGPGGPLLEPATVTCATTVDETPVHLWHAELRMTWEAGSGYPAGEWGWRLFFGADGDGGYQSTLVNDDNLVFPGTTSPAAEPVDGSLDLRPGSIVQMLAPGIRWDSRFVMDAYTNYHEAIGDRFVSDAQPGARFAVVDGQPISHNGADWYLVEPPMGSMYPYLFQWLPVTHDGLQLVREVEPVCPREPQVADLVRLLPAERVACYADQPLTLGPVMATLAEDLGFAADGDPTWLVDVPWRLYGEEGPAGLDGSLPVAIDPAQVDGMPASVPLTVTGHFADPTAASCAWRAPQDFAREPADLQHRRCSEIFVVTSVVERE